MSGERCRPAAAGVSEADGGGERRRIRRSPRRGTRPLSREMRLGPGGEGRDFLMPDMKPRDLALPADGVSEAVQAIADNP